MITITRQMARLLRAVFRRAGIKPVSYGSGGRVTFEADETGLKIRGMQHDLAIEYRQSGALEPETLSFPVQMLADVEGRQDDPVRLETRGKTRLAASWSDGGIPQTMRYDAEPRGKAGKFPEIPEQFTAAEPGLWSALEAAANSTDRESSRFALGCVQLNGAAGQIVGTDGRQVLIQRYSLPWSGEVLVPANGIFGCHELAGAGELSIGRTSDHVAWRLRDWIVWSRIEKGGRYPQIAQVIPPDDAFRSRLLVAPADAEFLLKALPRLPREDEHNEPVTLDLGDKIYVRATGPDGGQVAELVLSNSRLDGPPVRINTNRKHLARALKLGFSQLWVKDPDSIFLCCDERRQFGWMPLTAEGALKAAPDAQRIESPVAGSGIAPAPVSHPLTQQAPTPMQESNTPTAGNTTTVNQAGSQTSTGTQPRRRRVRASATMLEQAIALRDSLRTQANQAAELVRSIKRQRKQANLVQTTLNSLKELQKAG